MELLLTMFSVLALWGFLTVLVLGLFLILKPLESVRKHLERIAMGVRAIERETLPLRGHLEAVDSMLRDVTGELNA